MKGFASRLLYVGVFALSFAPRAFAECAEDSSDPLCQGSTAAKGSSNNPPSLRNFFADAANILLYLTAAIAVIVIIFGGLRYVTSTGDAARVKQAKDTILYGVVGLVVAILAYAIVNFVVKQLT